jgi:hypothetical protein
MRSTSNPQQQCARSGFAGRENCLDLLLPGALLMTVSAQLLAPFMLIDFRFSTFL